MDAYNAGQLVASLLIAGAAGVVIWMGVHRTRRGENGTMLIAVGAVLAIASVVRAVLSSG